MLEDATAATPRLVLDESSLDFRGLRDPEIAAGLGQLADLLDDLRADGYPPARSELVDYVSCLDDIELHEFFYLRGTTEVDRDVRLRAALAINHLPTWDADEPAGVPMEVQCAPAAEPVFAPSIGYALINVLNGRTVGCVVFPGRATSHSRTVSAECGEATVFFASASEQLPLFWRVVIADEASNEVTFFALASRAFPNLELHDSLTFRRFTGSYQVLRKAVTAQLSALHDHFPAVFAEAGGLPHLVQAGMARHGVSLSPESPGTRANKKAFAQRLVEHRGDEYVCDWHVKLHPARNRIHFALPDDRIDGRMFIGIFVDHLDT